MAKSKHTIDTAEIDKTLCSYYVMYPANYDLIRFGDTFFWDVLRIRIYQGLDGGVYDITDDTDRVAMMEIRTYG